MFSCDIDISSPFYFDFFINEIGIFYSIALQDNVEKGVYQDEHFLCNSFEKFLFQNAIQLYEYAYFNISVSFDLTFDYQYKKASIKQYPKQFKILDELSIKYNLKKAWFSDYNFYFTYSDEISIYVNNSYSKLGIIRGNDKALVDRICNDLLPKINARHI